MNIQEILAQEDFKKVILELTKDPKDKDKDIPANREIFDGKHDILTDPKKAPKTIGEGTSARTVTFTKQVVNYQKRIVNSAVTFLFGEPLTLKLNNQDESTKDSEEKAFEEINNVWKKNKLGYFNKGLARELFIETKVAEIWHIPEKEVDKDARIRVTLLTEKNGYKIYPHFDETGDMDAFTIKNEIMGEDNKPIEQVRIYTAETITVALKIKSKWEVTSRENIIHKIPIVYYEQDKPEWEEVETQITRMEYLLSNFSDTVDYNGAPMAQAKGIITDMPEKDATGKLIVVKAEQGEDGKVYYPGGLEYITWDQAPEAIKLEYGILKDLIYGLSQTPDLSFESVKGMTAISGIALRLMFSDAMFKAKDKQEIFGPAMERRLSIMKSLIAITNSGMSEQLEKLDIDIIFNSVLPADVEALITSLSTARAGEPIMSQETAVRTNPLVTDPEKDIELLEAEKTTNQSFAESFE